MFRIGVDLGGTNIAVGVVNERYELLAQTSVPTGAFRPYEEMVADMCRAIETAMEKAGVTVKDCQSIGVGSPGTCDSAAGVVVRAYNLGWFDVPLCQMLTAHFGIPAYLSNDANCAALAETVAGGAIGCRNMVLITLGTGVGGGIIIDGKIYAGMRSMGAELGHTVLVLDGEPCSCGRRGCWEAYASATALIRQAKAAAEQDSASPLHGRDAISAYDVFVAADSGCATAKAVIERWCEYVAAGLTDLVNALAPEKILIGGGVSRQGERILQPMRAYIERSCFGGKDGAIPVLEAAKLGNEAGIIGAAAL